METPMVRLPACFKVGTSKPAPEQREKSESAPLIDADLPLHNFKSVTLFMRRRSAWLCVAGAVLAYFAFLPPLLVIVPLMTEQFCTEWHAGIGVVMTLQSTGAIAPECTTLSAIVRLLPHDFFPQSHRLQPGLEFRHGRRARLPRVHPTLLAFAPRLRVPLLAAPPLARRRQHR